jgi:hypothetical protein
MLEDALEWLREIREEPLTRVTTGKLIAALVAIALLFLVEATSQEGWVPILDSLNLVFHESGHPLFSIFGETVGFLGGTLMQLLVPLVVTGTCWQKRQTVAIGLAGTWFFQNFLNIARYMADARAQLLPLVGGGEHDWNTLFGKWDVLAQDTAIARTVYVAGWLGMAGCAAWLLWRWSQDRHREPEEN